MFKFYLCLFFLIFQFTASCDDYQAIEYKKDDASKISIEKKQLKSHIKIYLPSIPYSYIMRLINGTLVRLNDSPKGWEYYLAKSHKQINSLTYEFTLRKDIKFQDGTPLTADSVVENINTFIEGAFTYTDIHNKLKSIEKISKYKVRIHLKKPYGMLLNDLARINLYTSSYLKKYAWSKNIIGENTKTTGAYGSGPYILFKGNSSGFSQSEEIELRANPYYFEKNKPYINKITIFAKLAVDDVIRKITEEEGELDIAVIPFDKKTEVVNSKYAKLVSTESTFNFSIHFNLMNPKSKFQNKKIRQALNQALNQENLVKFAYKNEGTISPFPISSNSFYAKELSKEYIKKPKIFLSENEILSLLYKLKIKVVTQDRFLSLWKGIEYQLSKYGVEIQYDITTDESYVLNKLLTNRKFVHDWDLLIWGNDDWYGHPWGGLFMLYSKNQWSAINKDEVLDSKFRNLFELEYDDKKFQPLVNEILEHAYEKAYMLRVPSPNFLLAVNKEVDFTPSSVAVLRLWESKLTPYHWSIRGDKSLPENRKEYILPKRIKNNE